MNFRLASAFPRVNLMIAHLLFLQQLSRYINEGREVKRILNNLQMMSCRKWLTEKDEASLKCYMIIRNLYMSTANMKGKGYVLCAKG